MTGPGSSSTRRRAALVAAVLLPVAVIAGVYLVFFTPSSPDRLELSTTPGSPPAATAGDIDGTWTPTPESTVGYRVREKLAGLPASSDAVGRTNAITGSVTLRREGDVIVAADARFSADLTRLRSDEPRRDNRLRTLGLETGRFPTATFSAAEPIRVPATALEGRPARVRAPGDLTIHGATRRVVIPLDVKLTGGRAEVVGSHTFAFADFGMETPNVGGFVSVESDPTLELKLVLERSPR